MRDPVGSDQVNPKRQDMQTVLLFVPGLLIQLRWICIKFEIVDPAALDLYQI
jgi:hypothetical protein